MIYKQEDSNGYYIINSYNNIENTNFIRYYREERINYLYYSYLTFLRERFKNRSVNDCILRNTAQAFATEEMSQLFQDNENHNIPYRFERILTENLKKKDINRILRECKLKTEDLFKIFVYLSKRGYKYSYYKIDKQPKAEGNNIFPKTARIKGNRSVEKSGDTTYSNAEIINLINNSNFLVARIFDNGIHWHCFLQTKFGILGKEPGKYGTSSHLHYISDKFGIKKEDLINSIKNGDYPSVNNHISIIDY